MSDVLNDEEGRAWADGNVRIGDYILLIDSDARVPADCLLDAASEMEQSPNVGILQYSSGSCRLLTASLKTDMSISWLPENATLANHSMIGLPFLTNLIYSAIRYTVANGDISPFVGHNAILRWSALQAVSYVDEDGYEKFWSESHVSEDFDILCAFNVPGTSYA